MVPQSSSSYNEYGKILKPKKRLFPHLQITIMILFLQVCIGVKINIHLTNDVFTNGKCVIEKQGVTIFNGKVFLA